MPPIYSVSLATGFRSPVLLCSLSTMGVYFVVDGAIDYDDD